MEIVIEAIKKHVHSIFKDESTGHDWLHIERVYNAALFLQEKEGGDRTIIALASLLHDISDHKFNGGDFSKGGKVACEILSQFSIPQAIIDSVGSIVENISFKGSGVADKMATIEGEIVQDADRLDAIGAVGIARTFAYGGAVGQPIYDPEIPPMENQNSESYQKNRTHTINHFYEKLLLLEERMHTDSAKKIARERTRFMLQFLDQFYREVESKL